MGKVIWFHDARASDSEGSRAVEAGRGMSSGHEASGQWSENHCSVRSSLATVIPAPPSIAASRLLSPSARQLTTERSSPVDAPYVRASDSRSLVPIMPAISVSLPQKSTAILPDAQIIEFSKLTAMGKRELITAIDARIADMNTSRNAVSIDAGHRDCIRNWDDGKSNPRYDTLSDLADVLGLDPQALWAIYKGRDPPPSRDISQRLNDLETTVGKIADAVLGKKRKAGKATDLI